MLTLFSPAKGARMTKLLIFNRHRFAAFLFYLFCLFLIILISSCGDGSYDSESSETASAYFYIEWHDTTASQSSENTRITKALDCELAGVDTIICEVYDESDTFLTYEAWPCSAGSGILYNLPEGVLTFVILGEDADGNILYHGETTSDITAGPPTNVGTIDAYSFVPTLLAPGDGSTVALNAFSLNWDIEENAYAYNILVSDSSSFDTTIIDDTTAGTSYTPSDLSELTTYYWKVFALDIHANQGAESAVWSFTIVEGSTIGDFPAFTPDVEDTQDLNVVQIIPPNGSVDIDPNTTISIFFNDEINPLTIDDLSIQVKDSMENQIFGLYSGDLSESGNTILNFQPYNTLTEDETITVSLLQANGVEDDGGNTLTSVFTFSFTTGQEIASPTDFGFEQGETGWNFSGDGAIVASPMDEISSTEGNYMAGISTGNVFGGEALDSTTSILSSGPISVPVGSNNIYFYYNFISEEFDEYVGTQYDDIFNLSIVGPDVSHSEIVTSVNIVGVENSYPVIFDGLTGADQTGWIFKTVDISALCSPITISFTVSDVGDAGYTTAVLFDNIYFVN